MGKHTLVEQACKADLINFTSDQVLALDSQFLAIVTVKPTTMYITCLTKTSYVELQHPLDIIFLEESCEASTPSMLLLSCTTLSKEISQTKLGFRQEQLKLNHTDIKDFTAIKYMPLKKLTEDQLDKWVQEIPDIKDILWASSMPHCQKLVMNIPGKGPHG